LSKCFSLQTLDHLLGLSNRYNKLLTIHYFDQPSPEICIQTWKVQKQILFDLPSNWKKHTQN
jgi:hypothetical protein